MKVSFFPKTKLGSLSVVLFVVLVVLLAYFFLMINVFDQRGGDTFFSNLNLTIPMLAAWACGAASFVLGLIAIIRGQITLGARIYHHTFVRAYNAFRDNGSSIPALEIRIKKAAIRPLAGCQ